MKVLTQEEFSDRVKAVQRATKIFGHMTDNDITQAFTAYQLVLAETPRRIMLNTQVHGNRAPTFLDNFERPKCPDCGADMMIRRVPPNDEGVNTQFVCSNDNCDTVLDSPMTLQEIISQLKPIENTEATHARP